jgi:hypothetical protein
MTPADPRLVEFASGDVGLRALLYEHGAPRPLVIMTHGFSGTIRGMVADRYAEVLHAGGLTVLLVEHASFGLSGGEPRQRINRWTQLIEYRDAITWAAGLPSVDPARIALWGDSMSGASALAAAAWDGRAAAVVVQVPACGSAMPEDDPDGGRAASLASLYGAGGPRGLIPEVVGPRAVVSSDQLTSPSLLEPITAFRWFIEHGGRHETRWQNVASLESYPQLPAFHVGLAVPSLRCPSLWVIAQDDEMPGAEAEIALACYKLAGGQKESLIVDGGHFGLLYHPSERFARASTAQVEFLGRALA